MTVNPIRRTLLKSGAAFAATSLAAPWVRAAGGSTFKIGYVSPQTGPLAAFAEPDAFTLEQVRKAVAGGLIAGGKKFAVEIIYKDSQSNPNRAGAVAAELILRDKVDLVIASSTPATSPGPNQGRLSCSALEDLRDRIGGTARGVAP